MRKIIKMFEDGNVCVCGLRGRGKDMLFANVVMRRKKPYVSNTDYGGVRYPFDPAQLDCGGNTWKNFMSGNVAGYVFPYPDGTDIYLADAGVYFPAQYCNELNKSYGHIATFMALSRHLGQCNVHFNVQNLNRCWDKIREQSDAYIMCDWCVVLFGIVFQRVTIYEKYQSAVDRVPVFCLPRPLLNPDRRFQWQMMYQSYQISHGEIKSRLLIYRNRSQYNTRIFKEMLSNAT